MSHDTILAKSPTIIWQPGGTAIGITVTEWSEVQAYIALREGACTVKVDASHGAATIPAGTTDCEGRVTFAAAEDTIAPQTLLTLADNAVLVNPATFTGFLHVVFQGASQPNLQLPTGNVLIVQNGAELDNQGTQPLLQLAASQVVAIAFFFGGSFRANPSALVAMPVATAAVAMIQIGNGGFQGTNNVITGVSGTTASINTDASLNGAVPTNPGFLGTFALNLLDKANLVSYTPGNTADWTNWGPVPDEVADALDDLAARTIEPLPRTSWAQATWFIDPSNSTGLANDANTGIDALHPVLTYNGGVAAKWGTYSPLLIQNTTITWLSGQPSVNPVADPVVFTPIIGAIPSSGNGAFVLVGGPLGVAQQLTAGVLASVTLKNRTTPQLLQADLGFAAPIGSIVQNTTKSSYASVYANVSGTIFELAQPIAPATAPVSVVPGTEVDTWANGDSFVLYQPVFVDLVTINATVTQFLPPNFTPQLQLQNLRSNAGGLGDANTMVKTNVALVNVTFDTGLVFMTDPNDIGNYYQNVAALAGVFDGSTGGILSTWSGGFILSPFGDVTLTIGNVGTDAIIDATSGSIGIASIGTGETVWGGNGGVYITGTIVVDSSTRLTVGDGAVMWGPGGIDGLGRAYIFYNETAVSTFLQTGATATTPPGAPLALNDLTTAYALNPSDPATWHPGRALTAANLDATIIAGGFAGLAISPGGATISTNP
jgi:hypothetical protein